MHANIFRFTATIFLVGLITSSAWARRRPHHQVRGPVSERAHHGIFDLALPHDPIRPRNTIFPPLASLILPGFDQWWEGQYGAAAIYSTTAIGGYTLMWSSAVMSLGNASAEADLATRDDRVRSFILGSKIVETSGELSAYHSFRSAVRSRQAHGDFSFLPRQSEESPDDLMLAPFHFSYLTQPTAFIPLGIMVAMLAASYSADNPHGLNLADCFFSMSTSYTAGIGEEAIFRGWMLPEFMENFDNRFWSNTATASLFGAAHISSDNQIPVAQFIMGWYLGWLSQYKNWTIGEGIFIHTWWDALSLLYDASLRPTSMMQPILVPLISATF